MGIADAATRAMVDNRLVPADLMVFSHYVQPLCAAIMCSHYLQHGGTGTSTNAKLEKRPVDRWGTTMIFQVKGGR